MIERSDGSRYRYAKQNSSDDHDNRQSKDNDVVSPEKDEILYQSSALRERLAESQRSQSSSVRAASEDEEREEEESYERETRVLFGVDGKEDSEKNPVFSPRKNHGRQLNGVQSRRTFSAKETFPDSNRNMSIDDRKWGAQASKNLNEENSVNDEVASRMTSLSTLKSIRGAEGEFSSTRKFETVDQNEENRILSEEKTSRIQRVLRKSPVGYSKKVCFMR